MSLKSFCVPRPSVFAQDRRVTVLSLDSFLKGQINGPEFFEENHFTNGMLTLVERAFKHLAGDQAGSSVFQLSQAMGGGKTHSMICLGLLAKDPGLRKKILGDKNPAPNLARSRVIGFNGRDSDAPGGIWGSLAEQLGKAAQFASYVMPLSAPGPNAWKELLIGEPVIIFLDELPPYLEYAASKHVGNSDLANVTTTALANLMVAVTGMDNVCLVISDLAGNNYRIGEDRLKASVDRATQEIQGETRRIAVPITPVNPNGDELYHILRKRLFEKVAPKAEIETVAKAYQAALQQAKDMNLTTTLPTSLYTRILDSYPFHPDFRELLGKFKENEGFQQTRGVIRLMQMLVSDLWQEDKADNLDLVHPYDIDLDNDELASEMRTINTTLSEAIAHDIAHKGEAEVEMIDRANGTTDASDAAKVVLLASLSTTPGAQQGLREYQLVDCLQRPGRNLSTFRANVLDKLATRAWYLHASADGRLFFKNQQNLAAKLTSTANALHAEVVERMLKESLQTYFDPTVRDCYQLVEVVPAPDAVKIEMEKTTLIIVRPGFQANGLPISADWQAWWRQQEYKNRVIFVSGSRDTYQKVVDAARQQRALQSIEEDLKAQNMGNEDPQWRALDTLKVRVGLQFQAAQKEAFDQVIYPSIKNALRSAGIELAFVGNQSGEAIVRKTLEIVQKFTTKFDDEVFLNKAEARLFGSAESKVVLWSDFKRAAAVQTEWPFHKPSALEDIKGICLKRDRWRAEGNHIRRGPFPLPTPEVDIRELSMVDEGQGETYLKIEALYSTKVVYETGDSNPTASSSPVPTPARFEAKGLRYRFLALDPAKPDRLSPIKEWSAKLRLKQQLHNRGDHYELELHCLPKANGIVIRYTTDGSAPSGATSNTYEGPFKIPKGAKVALAVAYAKSFQLQSETARINIPQDPGNGGGKPNNIINPLIPAQWKKSLKWDDAGAVWQAIAHLEKLNQVVAHSLAIGLESSDGNQHLDYNSSLPGGYSGAELKALVEKLQELIGTGRLRMTIGNLRFPTGQALLDWLAEAKIPFERTAVEQIEHSAGVH